MIILKFTGVFEIRVHSKMIILKWEQMFLNYTLFCFQVFPKGRGVYLEPSQTSKMEKMGSENAT